MQTTVEGIIYLVTDANKKTAIVGNNTGITGNAVGGTISNSIVFKEFIEIENNKYEITEIGCRAFENCQIIESVIIHPRIRIINSFSFDQCINLNDISFAEGSKLEKLGYASFYHTASKSIVLPKSLKTIEDHSFCRCSNLKLAVYFGKNKINNSVFDYNSTLADPTPSDLQIIVSPLYKYKKFGGRNVSKREWELIKCTCNYKRSYMNKSIIIVFIIILS